MRLAPRRPRRRPGRALREPSVQMGSPALSPKLTLGSPECLPGHLPSLLKAGGKGVASHRRPAQPGGTGAGGCRRGLGRREPGGGGSNRDGKFPAGTERARQRGLVRVLIDL